MMNDTSTLILDTKAPGWETKAQQLVDTFGQKRRSKLDAQGMFMIETVTPVVIEGVYVLLGQWPVPAGEPVPDVVIDPVPATSASISLSPEE